PPFSSSPQKATYSSTELAIKTACLSDRNNRQEGRFLLTCGLPLCQLQQAHRDGYPDVEGRRFAVDSSSGQEAALFLHETVADVHAAEERLDLEPGRRG